MKIKCLALGVITALCLVACGGGGGGDSVAPVPPRLSGTAAVGSPIVGATVTVRCAGGVVLTIQTTRNDGSWSVVVNGQSFPCAAQLNGGMIDGVQNTVQLHSLALSVGTMNVTPLTDLMVAFATNRTIPSQWFDGLTSTSFNDVNANSVKAALSVLVDTLHMTQLGTTYHPMTTAFNPAPGSVLDDTLSSLSAALRDVGMVYADLRTLVATPNAMPSSGLLVALTTRYINSVSGVRASGGVNTTTGLSANGSPKVVVSACATASGANTYLRCQMNAVANFGPLSVVDGNTHQTCVASYTNGTLTISNGTMTVVGYLNGNLLSDIDTFTAGDILHLNAWASSSGVMQMSTLTWDDAGRLRSISGRYSSLLKGSTDFTCAN